MARRLKRIPMEENRIPEETEEKSGGKDFIRTIIEEDLAAGKNGGRIHTRFPPEPNGYLHIGHAKAIVTNYGIAEDYGGKYNLRFDDTNPVKEETEYVNSMIEDIRWLGYDWEDRLFYASDYFEQLFEYALTLIKEDKAYVDSLSAQEIREYRGTLTKPGKDSPYRNRSREENLELFLRIRNGEFEEGAHVLRAKIDMASPNLNMRDPTLYRIRKAHHIRTGDTWCIYPMYDFAHSLSDAIEGITHSLCDISFENHRPLYDWFIENLPVPAAPRQIEFARLNITYTILHKRKLRRLVEEGHVTGWDDPRMPTLSGLRRRGYTPEAIKSFIKAVGLSKVESMVDHALLEYHLREDLNARSPRVMAVLKPLKVVITNWPTGKVEMVPAVNNPEDPASGTRLIPFSKEIYIEQDDFMEDPPKKYFRLSPGREIRLKHAYYIRCDEVIKDPDTGCIRELRCTYDPESRGGMTPDGRKVRGTSHWVSVEHAVPAEVRIYDHLFTKPDPENTGEGEEFIDFFNTDSLTVLTDCRVEPGLRDAKPGTTCQFLRQGYFCPDSKDSSPDHLVFNRTVGMRDTWAKIQKKK